MANYKFESAVPAYGSEDDIKADIDVFKSRIFADDVSTNFEAVNTTLFRRYVIANHRAVHWYNQARDKRRKLKEKYAIGRMFLLVLLPIGVLILSAEFTGGDAKNSTGTIGFEVNAAILTAVLTGLMAAFRASSEWMEAKFAASNFAVTASLLKEGIYAFENEWRGKDLSEKAQVELFNQALDDGITKAREIANKQRQDYFNASAPPSINILESLAAAKTDAAALLKNYQSPKLTQALKDQEEEIAARKLNTQSRIESSRLTSLINARGQLIKEKEQLLNTEQDESRKQYLKNFIKTLQASQQADELSLLEKIAVLEAKS